MKILLSKNELKINFTLKNKILSLKSSFKIPLSHIKRVTTEIPKPTWKEIKAPGTHIPGLIKAGTYYSKRGKEFWYISKGKEFLNIELKNESYKRLIIGVKGSKSWARKIDSFLQEKK